MRSQCGPLASDTFTAVPTSRMMRIDVQPFRLLLLRRLRLPLPLTSRTCRCGRLLDSSGIHRAACSVVWERVPIGASRCTGVQRSRGESEDQHGSGRCLRALWTEIRSCRGRLDVVARGTIRHRHHFGVPFTQGWRTAANQDGVALQQARPAKETNHLSRSLSKREEGHVWWCSLPKSGGDGPRRRHNSCSFWPK